MNSIPRSLIELGRYRCTTPTVKFIIPLTVEHFVWNPKFQREHREIQYLVRVPGSTMARNFPIWIQKKKKNLGWWALLFFGFDRTNPQP